MPVARHGDVRLGTWAELRTSSGPVVTAAVAFGYVGPWYRRDPWMDIGAPPNKGGGQDAATFCCSPLA